MKAALRFCILPASCLVIVLVLVAINRQEPTAQPQPETASNAEQGPTGQPDGAGPERGAPQGLAEAAAQPAETLGSPIQDSPGSGVSTPLVFQDVDLAAMNLDAGQRRAIADLRQRFVEALGGPNQDPAEPGYRERWLQSQAENDSLLRAMIGVRAWQDYQLAGRKHE
ncbi:MAG: hypothetical protein ACLQVX_15365 [Limisphaerales bacterium]